MKAVLDVLYFILMIPVYFLENLYILLIPKSWRAKDVAGEVVLITGAGGGIGRSLALRFASLGCTVVGWDINQEGNRVTAQMVKESGGTAYAYTCDITKKDDVYKAAEITKKDVGTVTILINNAGIVTGTKLLETSDNLIQQTFKVNALAHFWTIKAFLPDMIKMSKGHIVNVSSVAGLMGGAKLTDYCSSKFASVGFTEALHKELMEDGYDKFINVTAVCPFHILTEMFQLSKGFRLIPSSTPENAADCIVAGILANDLMVYIPRYFGLLMFFYRILPWKLSYHALELCEITDFMKRFQRKQI